MDKAFARTPDRRNAPLIAAALQWLMAREAPRATGWFPVARAAEVGTTPVPVSAGGQAYVVVRLRPGGEVSAFPARCPHRLVPLAAGAVVDGRLACPAHGWRFDGEGRCVDIPSLGEHGAPPPRADLRMPWAVEERHGWVWLAPERTATPLPLAAAPPVRARAGAARTARLRVRQPRPLARARLAPGGAVPGAAAGRLAAGPAAGPELDAAPGRRTTVTADPPAFGVRERLGVIWLAPAGAGRRLLDVPEAARPKVRDRLDGAGALPRAGRPAGRHVPRRDARPVRARGHHRRRDRTEVRRPGHGRAGRVQQRAGAVVRQPGRPGGGQRRAAAAAAATDDVHLPGAVPAPAAAGVPRLRRDDDDRVPAAARGPRLHPHLRRASCSPPARGSRCTPRPRWRPRWHCRSRSSGGRAITGGARAVRPPAGPARRGARAGRPAAGWRCGRRSCDFVGRRSAAGRSRAA